MNIATHQLGPCVVCGTYGYSMSMGGPGICPKCDCGNFDSATVETQAKAMKRLRDELEVSEAANRAKTELLIDVVALLSDGDCTPGQRVMNARTAIAVRTGPPRSQT